MEGSQPWCEAPASVHGGHAGVPLKGPQEASFPGKCLRGWGFREAGAEILARTPPEACFCQCGKGKRLLQVRLCPEVAFCGPLPSSA